MHIPDPASEATFLSAKLNMAEREKHMPVYALHRDLLELRRTDPVIGAQDRTIIDGAVLSEHAWVLRWFDARHGDRLLLVNLAEDMQLHPAPEPLLAPPANARWRTVWSSDASRYDGPGRVELSVEAGWYLSGESAVLLAAERLAAQPHPHWRKMTEQDLAINWQRQSDPEALRNREWLVTNGLGGYASGTLLGTGSRRYHGLFVPNLPDPKGRYILISRFDEEVACDGQRVRLGGAEFIDGQLETEAHFYLARFFLDYSVPTWIFQIGDATIEKSIVMPYRQNTVYVHYRLLRGTGAELKLRPFAAFRRQDAVLRTLDERPFLHTIARHRHVLRLHDSPLQVGFGLCPDSSVFVVDERESMDVFYRVEHDRGYDHSENTFSPGYFSAELQSDKAVTFIATTHSIDGLVSLDGAAALDAERNSRQAIAEYCAGRCVPGIRRAAGYRSRSVYRSAGQPA